MHEVIVSQFIGSFSRMYKPLVELVLDFDPTDEHVHGDPAGAGWGILLRLLLGLLFCAVLHVRDVLRTAIAGGPANAGRALPYSLRLWCEGLE